MKLCLKCALGVALFMGICIGTAWIVGRVARGKSDTAKGTSAGRQMEWKAGTNEVKVPAEVKHPDISAACRSEVDHAVMNKVEGSFRQYDSVSGTWATETELKTEQTEIDKRFAWSQGISDDAIRRCYESWLGYEQYELAQAWQAYNENRTQRAYESTHKIPIFPGGPK